MDHRRLERRVAELVGWGATASVGLVMISQALGWDGSTLVATLQSLTPYGLVLLVVVAAVAVSQRWYALAATTAVVGLSVMGLSIPLVMPADQPDALPNTTGVRAAAVNLLYSNTEVAAAADDLADRDLDVIVFSEYTNEHARTLRQHPLDDSYPHQINRTGLRAGGMAIWSRYPISESRRSNTINRTIDAMLEGPDGDIRVLAVHPPTPIFDFDGWQRDIRRIGVAASDATEPLLVIGDFNASYWHPVFRDLMDRDLTDAHIANGSGWTASWPTDEFVPPFVRLDHALTGNGLVSSDVHDFRVPGSDHVGFVVTIKPSVDASR